MLEPKGYEAGYPALVGRSTTLRLGDVEIRVGALADLVRSKELLRRAKDVEHLAILYEQRPELSHGFDPGSPPQVTTRSGYLSLGATFLSREPDLRALCAVGHVREFWPVLAPDPVPMLLS